MLILSSLLDGTTPSEGPLERGDLVRLVERIAAHRELWAPYLDLDAKERTYAALHRDDLLDVWAIFWLPENDTGWHDHDTSCGAVHVVEGAVEEHVLCLAQPQRHTRHAAGASFSFGPSHIHRLTCTEPRAASIHAYSPPLWRLGQYTSDPDGALQRVSVSYADELRPLGPGALLPS
jgi:predicted metal-dependent enzyme (double-stranded beta helix superfamily)